jgi:hypothetical protein
MKPVAVVTLASYDKLLHDVDFIGQSIDNPGLAKGIESLLTLVTGGQGLAGFDKSRPVAVVVETDGTHFSGYGLLPVTDLKRLLALVTPLAAKVTDVGDGVFAVYPKGKGQITYVKQGASGWAVLGNRKETPAEASIDPQSLLAGLGGEYDVAIRVSPQNLPAQLRQGFLQKIQADAQRDMDHRRPQESDDQFAARKLLTRKVVDTLVHLADDIRYVTLGWNLDPQSGKDYLDVSLTATPGTRTAQCWAKQAETKTHFAGFLQPGAALAGLWTNQFPPVDTAELNQIFTLVRKQALADVDRKEPSAEKARVGKEVVGGLLDTIQQTVASARLDGALAVKIEPHAATVVAGAYVADGAKIQTVLDRLLQAARAENAAVVDQLVRTNADQLRDVHFHTITIPLPDETKGREKLVQLVGDSLELVIGIGKNSVYFAAGRDALPTLKQAIEASSAEGSRVAAPMQLAIAVAPILRTAAAFGTPDVQAKTAAAIEMLKGAEIQDHIRLVATPIDNGLRLRLEAEKDVVRLFFRSVLLAQRKP